MGCTNSNLFSPYTEQEVDAEVARVTPGLPVAELMNGGIIKLEGANGFFNPNSLLDPSWLKGKMTAEEYWQAIDYINKCTAHTHVGLSKIYSTSERPMRENLKAQAGMPAVQQLNERFKSVRFTYQQTSENMQLNTAANPDPTLRYMQRGQAPIANAAVTVLYILVK